MADMSCQPAAITADVPALSAWPSPYPVCSDAPAGAANGYFRYRFRSTARSDISIATRDIDMPQCTHHRPLVFSIVLAESSMSPIPPQGQARPRHAARPKPPFTIEMLEFEDTLGILPFPKERLAEPSSTLGDAKLRGKDEASSCVVE